MEEVTETALPAWLARARADGWALVGLEQTAESTPLPDFEWPRRTVLLLGRCCRTCASVGSVRVRLPTRLGSGAYVIRVRVRVKSQLGVLLP